MYFTSEGISKGQGYFERLENREKATYLQLLQGILQRSSEIAITLGSHETEQIKRAIVAVYHDHPELYYINFTHCNIRKRGSTTCIYFNYLYTSSEILQIDRALSASWNTLKEKLTPRMTIKKQYQVIALEIASTVRYEKTEEEPDWSVVGPVMRRSGVCEGISKLFCYYCQQAGIPALLISGTCEEKPHAWNQVWINGKARYLDITVMQECPILFRIFPGLIFMSKTIARWLGYRQQI